jgi:hypothetical protein
VLETVYFVLFDAPTRATFEKTWERMKRELAAGAAGA